MFCILLSYCCHSIVLLACSLMKHTLEISTNIIVIIVVVVVVILSPRDAVPRTQKLRHPPWWEPRDTEGSVPTLYVTLE